MVARAQESATILRSYAKVYILRTHRATRPFRTPKNMTRSPLKKNLRHKLLGQIFCLHKLHILRRQFVSDLHGINVS
jgi:hypothetical protein